MSTILLLASGLPSPLLALCISFFAGLIFKHLPYMLSEHLSVHFIVKNNEGRPHLPEFYRVEFLVPSC